ncbi:hypothetical protein Acr_16g0003420 [Actinidia rufa]|uniref:Reverse transcriptase zinc-binding domain-containing protein n=1 Tax=Actinidia rufa TaxID=165716 RepID=A0A7J0G0K4_9ERIC|nr:hypothetical protein Acr_16g0003420 [Actinidia rufa]
MKNRELTGNAEQCRPKLTFGQLKVTNPQPKSTNLQQTERVALWNFSATSMKVEARKQLLEWEWRQGWAYLQKIKKLGPSTTGVGEVEEGLNETLGQADEGEMLEETSEAASQTLGDKDSYSTPDKDSHTRFDRMSRMFNVNLQLLGRKGMLRKPIHMDKLTSQKARVTYARCLVEIDLAKDLPHSVTLELLGEVEHEQAIFYENLPRFCPQCRMMGHTKENCKMMKANTKEDKSAKLARKDSKKGEGTRGNRAGLKANGQEDKAKTGSTEVRKVLEAKIGNKFSPLEGIPETEETEVNQDQAEPEAEAEDQADPEPEAEVQIQDERLSTVQAPSRTAGTNPEQPKKKRVGETIYVQQANQFASAELRNKLQQAHKDTKGSSAVVAPKKVPTQIHYLDGIARKKFKSWKTDNNFQQPPKWQDFDFLEGRQSQPGDHREVRVGYSLPGHLFSSSIEMPWMLLGDFNNVLNNDEKANGLLVTSYETRDFRNCCYDTGISGLRSSGVFLTWSINSVWSKLDRAMVNKSQQKPEQRLQKRISFRLNKQLHDSPRNYNLQIKVPDLRAKVLKLAEEELSFCTQLAKAKFLKNADKGTNSSDMEAIKDITKFSQGSFPFSAWAGANLSYAGRTELVKSVLQGVECFWLSILPILAGVKAKIVQLCRNFLWSGNCNSHKRPLVAWEEVILPKSEGGLGIRNIKAWNKALISKTLWDIQAKKDSIWVQWVHQIYMNNRSFWEYNSEDNVEGAIQRINQWTSNGDFQSNKAYDYFRPRRAKLAWPKMVWHSVITPKHSFILWLGLKEKLLTRDKLQDFIEDLECPLCRSEAENN